MITRKAGRAYHARTENEENILLEDAIKDLTPEEAATVLQILQERSKGVDATARSLQNQLYDRPVLPVEEWLEDDYYFARASRTFYPKMKQHMINIVNGNYYTVIATGSTAIGKTYIGTHLLARLIYELSCMRCPQEAYGHSSATEIHIILLSKNLHLARTVLLSPLIEKLKESPYFMTEFPFDEKADRLRFPKNITVQIGSVNSERVIGLTVIGFLMDETDFLGGSRHKPQIAGVVGQKLTVANYDAAERIYSKLTARVKGRFMIGGRLPGYAILLSSKTTTSSFTERRITELKDDPNAYIIDHPTWEVKEADYGHERFKVLIGSHTVRPRILNPDEEISKEFLDSTGSMVIEVPKVFKPEFEKNLYEAIRDTAGLSTDAISSFITHQKTLFEPTIQADMEHPFSEQQWVLGVPGFRILWEKMCELREVRLSSGHIEKRWVPKRNPHLPRVIHIDTSLTGDRTGMSMGYITRMVEVERFSPESARAYYEMAPEIEIDFCVQIAPQLGEYIELSELRAFEYEIQDHGFHIVRSTTDTYGSNEHIQQLRHRGIDSDILSVDRDPVAYECLRSALQEGRMRMYHYQPFIDEMLKLERDPNTGKIDHPLGGCFTGDTRVMLANGEMVAFDQLVDLPLVEVVSFDGESFCTRIGVRPHITKFVTELIEIMLEDGSIIRCTPDHLFMLSDGSYVEAQFLTCGSHLMSIIPVSVASVTAKSLDTPIPVYDMMVPGTENFVLSSGIVVHNSKDCSDSVAGVVASLEELALSNPGLFELVLGRQQEADPDNWFRDMERAKDPKAPFKHIQAKLKRELEDRKAQAEAQAQAGEPSSMPVFEEKKTPEAKAETKPLRTATGRMKAPAENMPNDNDYDLPFLL